MFSTTIPYNSSQSLIYDANEIDLLADKAQLKKKDLQANELLFASAKSTLNADRFAGANGDITTVGSVGLIDYNGSKYYDLSVDGSSNYLSISDVANFGITNNYCIRFKIVPLYTGNPVKVYDIFSMSIGTSVPSLISMSHQTNGVLRLDLYSSTSSSVSHITEVWSPTANQEYEIEINCNGTTSYIFIDGVLFSSVPHNVTVTARDRLYFGASKTGSGSSNYYVRDINIFNTAKHTTDFTGEIPRVESLFNADEAIVEVAGYLVTEGLFNLAAIASDSTRYLVKIENSYYYYNGASVVVSDKTYSQASTITQLVDNIEAVNALILSGKRIKLVPVLNSGANQGEQSFITSTTIDYDFYAIAEPFESCIVYGFIYGNTEAISSSTVRIYSKKPVYQNGKIVLVDITVSTDESGYFEVDVPVNDLLAPYQYELTMVDSSGKTTKDKGSIVVPQQDTVSFITIKQ